VWLAHGADRVSPRSVGDEAHLAQLETADAGDVTGVRGVERQVVREGGRRDERVERSCSGASACRSQLGGDAGECAWRRSIEGERVEGRLGLLQRRLARNGQ
jgi:hypothetical protein